MSKFLKWLLKSSENPQEIGITARGILLLAVPSFLACLKQMGIDFDGNLVVTWIDTFCGILGLVLVVIGVFNKLIVYLANYEPSSKKKAKKKAKAKKK